MLIFKKLRFKNILSYGSNITEIVLDEQHTTLLHGDSGSGKSTILDVLCFVLYNKSFRDINKAQIINSVNNKDCLAECEFSVGGNDFLIRRGIKPNIFEIHKSGVLLNQDSHSKDYQDFLEKSILGLSFKTFCQVVVLGAANFVPFMQLKLADRRDIVENLLDIKIFSVMSQILNQKQQEIKNAISEKDLRAIQSNDKIQIVKKFTDELKKQLEDKINKNNETISGHTQEISVLDEEIKRVSEKIIARKQEITKYKNELLSKQNALNTKKNELTWAIKKEKTNLEFYKNNDSCSTCKQPIDQIFKEKEIKEKQENVENTTKKIAELEPNLKILDEKLAEVQTAIDKLAAHEQRLQEKKSEKMSRERLVGHLTSEIKSTQLEIQSKFSKSSSNEIDILYSQLNALNAELDELKIQKNVAEIAAELIKDSGIKSLIIKQYIPYINKYVNKFLNIMEFYVKFSLNEQFDEKIYVGGNDALTYYSFSEGEKQRLDLALLFTWRMIAKVKNSVNTNLLILDELLDSYLDQNATENVIELLNSDIFADNNILVISHKDTLFDKFDRCIKFKKINGFSRISE